MTGGGFCLAMLAQAGSAEGMSWSWIIGGVVGLLVVAVLLYLLRAGKSLDHTVRLVVTRGAHSGEAFTLKSAFATIGSEKDNDIVVTDEKISRHHARLKYHRGRLEVVDLNTLYGTSINGTRVERADSVHGDTLALGPAFECRIEIDGQP